MARTHTAFSLAILSAVARASGVCSVQQLLTGQIPGGKNRKAVYDTIFRLTQQGFLEYANPARTQLALTSDGKLLLATRFPERDGVWKMVIFDIPERQRQVRTFLRSKLKALGFKKWQSSIWLSPYKLDPRLEAELGELAGKFFIRLIKTTDINYTKDLEKLFPDV
jgi:DNA-binding transcriptional regulator PaaX